jgi:vitamin B12 transporter
MLQKILVSLLLVGVLYHFSWADENVVVTASKIETQIAQTPSYTQVVTQKQIENSGALFAQDALNGLPGISISSNGPFGGQTSFYMRGLRSYYTKYLMDGVNIGDPSLMQSQFDMSSLLPYNLSRIEIVQGSQSGLYGADAIAGVVNFITKKGEGKPHATYTQMYGSFGTYAENLSYSGKVNNFSFYLDGTRFDTSGTSKMNSYNHQTQSYSYGGKQDGYHQTAFNSRLEYDLNDFKIGLLLNAQKTQNYMDQYSPTYFVPDNSSWLNTTYPGKSYREDSENYLTKIYAQKTFNKLTLKFDTYYFEQLRYYKDNYSYPYPPVIPAPQSDFYNNNYKGYRYGNDLQLEYVFSKNFKTVGGINYTVDRMSQDYPNYFSKNRDNIGAFVEFLPSIGNLNLQAAFREDHFQTFGDHGTYKLGASYLFEPTGTILKANWSTGFRAPSLFELYVPSLPARFFSGGNANLSPERSKSWDVGFMQNIFNNKISFGATYFRTTITDRIAYYTNPNTWMSTYENVPGDTVATGIESYIKVKPVKQVELGLNYTYTDSTNPNTNMQTARIPYSVTTGYINYSPIDKLTLHIDGKYIGTRYDDDNHTHQTGRYTVFDGNIAYNITKDLKASLAIYNIFNRFYQDIWGYTTLKRSAYATVSYTF